MLFVTCVTPPSDVALLSWKQLFPSSGQLRPPQVFLSSGILFQALHFRALYWSCVTVLVVNNVTIVNNYVDSINSKYHVTMTTTPPTVNKPDTWNGLNHISQNAESKYAFNELKTNVRQCLQSDLSYSEGMRVLLVEMRQ